MDGLFIENDSVPVSSEFFFLVSVGFIGGNAASCWVIQEMVFLSSVPPCPVILKNRITVIRIKNRFGFMVGSFGLFGRHDFSRAPGIFFTLVKNKYFRIGFAPRSTAYRIHLLG